MNNKSLLNILCLTFILTNINILFMENELVHADVTDFREIFSLDFDIRIESIDWNPNGTQIAVGLFNGYINVYNSSTYQLELAINATWYPTQIGPKWNPNGSLIAGGGKDNRVHIFDAITGEQLKYFEIYEGYAFSIAWSPDGKLLANGNRHNNLTQIWNVTTGEKVTEFGYDNMSVRSISWSPDGTMLATTSEYVNVWYTSNWTKITSFKSDQVASSIFSPNGKLLAISDLGYNISIYYTSDWSLYRKIMNEINVISIDWNPNSTMIVCGYDTYQIGIDGIQGMIWDVINEVSVGILYSNADGFNTVAWSPNGKLIALTPENTMSGKGILKIWGEPLNTIRLVSFTCNNAELEIGQNLSCTAIIRNYGLVNGTNLSLRFYLDENLISERIFNITKKETVEKILELKLTNNIKLGKHIMKAKLNNDEKMFQVTINHKSDIGQPEIYIKDIQVNQNVVTIGQTVIITVTLGNNGSVDSPDTLCTLFLELDLINSTHLLVKQNSTESFIFELNTKGFKPEDYIIKAVTGNQSKEITITINPKVETTVSPNTLCISIMLLLILIILIITLYSKKQRK